MIDKLKNLVSVLASPESDITGGWWVSDQFIDCISIQDGEVILCIWDGSYEHQINARNISEHDLQNLIEDLEQILYN